MASSGGYHSPVALDKADVYAAALIIWELWTRDTPYKFLRHKNKGANAMMHELAQALQRGIRPQIPVDMGPGWATMLQEMWSPAPRLRPSFRTVLQRLNAPHMLEELARRQHRLCGGAVEQQPYQGGHSVSSRRSGSAR